MKTVDADFEEILPKGRIVHVELDVLLPADATKAEIESWLNLQFGRDSLPTACALGAHQPEIFGDLHLTDTREQGRIEDHDLRRTGDGLAYTPVLVRRAIGLPPEPLGEAVWLHADGRTARERRPDRPSIIEMMSQMLGNLAWTMIDFEGRKAMLFYQASGWRRDSAVNAAATALLAGTQDARTVQGTAMVFVPPAQGAAS